MGEREWERDPPARPTWKPAERGSGPRGPGSAAAISRPPAHPARRNDGRRRRSGGCRRGSGSGPRGAALHLAPPGLRKEEPSGHPQIHQERPAPSRRRGRSSPSVPPAPPAVPAAPRKGSTPWGRSPGRRTRPRWGSRETPQAGIQPPGNGLGFREARAGGSLRVAGEGRGVTGGRLVPGQLPPCDVPRKCLP